MDQGNRKYLDVIEQWEQEPLSFQSLSAKRLEAASSASELSQLKDYLSKLKFNYLELETKRLFLQQLRTNGPPSRHAVQHTEIEMEESKKKLKDLKAANEKLTNDITALINTIADGYAEFEKDKKALLKELEVFQQLQEARAASLEQAPVPRHITQQLNNYKTANHAMLSLCGFDVHDVSPNVMRVTLRFEDAAVPTTSLTFTFVHNTQQLSDATLSPPLVSFEDLLEEALRANDAAFLIRETHARIVNAFATKKEIAALQSVYSLTLEADTVTARFGAAAVVLKLGSDYPQPHARVSVVRVEGVEKAVADTVKAAMNAAPVAPLTQVLSAVQQRLEGGAR